MPLTPERKIFEEIITTHFSKEAAGLEYKEFPVGEYKVKLGRGEDTMFFNTWKDGEDGGNKMLIMVDKRKGSEGLEIEYWLSDPESEGQKGSFLVKASEEGIMLERYSVGKSTSVGQEALVRAKPSLTETEAGFAEKILRVQAGELKLDMMATVNAVDNLIADLEAGNFDGVQRVLGNFDDGRIAVFDSVTGMETV